MLGNYPLVAVLKKRKINKRQSYVILIEIIKIVQLFEFHLGKLSDQKQYEHIFQVLCL